MSLPRCAHCGRRDSLEAGFDTFKCLNCNGDTDYKGNALPREPRFEAEGALDKQRRTGFANG